MANKIVNQIKKLFSSQLAIPLVALIVLVVFNLIRDPSFFSIVIKKNNMGNTVLSGNLISILNGASELVILAIGMTLVTSATKGQDISIGAAAAIAGSVAEAYYNIDNSIKETALSFLDGYLLGIFNEAEKALIKG